MNTKLHGDTFTKVTNKKGKKMGILLISMALLFFITAGWKIIRERVSPFGSVIFESPINLADKGREYNFEYTHKWWGSFDLEIKLKRMDEVKVPYEINYFVEIFPGQIQVKLQNGKRRIVDTVITKSNLGIGCLNRSIGISIYTHRIFDSRRYNLFLKIIAGDERLNLAEPIVLVAQRPTCGLEAVLELISLIILGIITMILGIRRLF